jgi:hypothetical protein
VTLLAEKEVSAGCTHDTTHTHTEFASEDNDTSPKKQVIHETAPRQHVREFQSRSQLSSSEKNQRHFSFEPGQDSLQALKEKLATSDALQLPEDTSRATASSACSDAHSVSVVTPPQIFTSPYQVPNNDLHNQSKIPSPVHTFGSVRRQTSISSLQSVITMSNNGRHASHFSIQTAFRRQRSSSRSSSFNNLRGADVSPASKDRLGSVRVRNSVNSLTSDRANHNAVSPGNSPPRSHTKSLTSGSSSRAVRNVGPHRQENDEPRIRD